MMDIPEPGGDALVPHNTGIQIKPHARSAVFEHLEARISELCRIQKQNSVALLRIEMSLRKLLRRMESNRRGEAGGDYYQDGAPQLRTSSPRPTQMEEMLQCWSRGTTFASPPTLDRRPGQCRLNPTQPWVHAAKQCQCSGPCQRV
jgi:hypothetical protein